jgi:AraC-like DNA-binding protein
MKHYHHIPAPPLSEYIDMLWLYERGADPPTLERALPTGTVEMVIDLGGGPVCVYDRNDPTHTLISHHGPMLCGPHTGYFVIDNLQPWVLGAHFKPGGAFPFLGLPASELHDQHAALADLWGASAFDLQECVMDAPTPAAMFRILEAALLDRLCNPVMGHHMVQHPAVAFALREIQYARPLTAVTDQIGLSTRRFSQLFGEQVGLSPKRYQRVMRFQDVLRRIYASAPLDWADVALDCGFFDQAHFIHEFRAFSGLSPTEYMAQRGRHQNHVSLP